METARAAGLRPQSLLTQRELLLRLGLEARVQQLVNGNPDQSTAISEAAQRLIDDSSPIAMGRLFKAAAMASADITLVPGFDRPDPALKVPS
jgi:NADH dehydrogenase [ubiquinone] 1 alpha subcomplex assembly factor 7